MPVAQRVGAAADPQPRGDGPVDDDERRAGMCRGLHGVEIEAWLGERADGRDHHRQMFGRGAGQHRVDGDGLARGATGARRQRGHDLRAPIAVASEHASDALWRRRKHRQAIRPALVHRPALEGIEIVGPVDSDRRDRGRGAGRRCRVTRESAQRLRRDPLRLGDHQLWIDAADRVRHEHHRQVRQPVGGRLGARQRDERIRAEDDGRHASPFQHHRVVDTPRRARPSVGSAGEDDVRRPPRSRPASSPAATIPAWSSAGWSRRAPRRPAARPLAPAGRRRSAWSCRGRRCAGRRGGDGDGSAG